RLCGHSGRFALIVQSGAPPATLNHRDTEAQRKWEWARSALLNLRALRVSVVNLRPRLLRRELAQLGGDGLEGAGEAVDRVVDLRLGDGERRREGGDLDEGQGARQDAVFQRLLGDDAVRVRPRREEAPRLL